MGKVVLKTGVTVQAQVNMYKAFFQLVFVYGSDSRVVMGAILKKKEGFHHWLTRSITRMVSQYKTGGEWECPPTRSIYSGGRTLCLYRWSAVPCYNLCTGAERMQGESNFMRW